VNTGELVTGTAERRVTGDAVNVAARLEQAAETLREALTLFERKGNVVYAARTRPRLEALGVDAPA
jgi:class 3 adenylate cyclase